MNPTLTFEGLYQSRGAKAAQVAQTTDTNPSTSAGTGLGHLAEATGQGVAGALGLQLPALVALFGLAIFLIWKY